MNRLQTICSLIPRSSVIADVGCDHGKISEYIVKNGLAQVLIVNDISAPSLEKAKKRLASCESRMNKENIWYYCCDGVELADLADGIGINCAVIAGMGGREILRILETGIAETVILAPQNFADGVRKGLWELGYRVETDILVQDNNKFYDVLHIVYGGKTYPVPSESKCMYGYFYQTKNDILLARLLRDKQKIESYPQTPENQRKLSVIEEVLKWQR
ncbi:MAG: class I SAM-dependent methyltransferase [Firmicutes bacterium]|nr:class I SAM-dependent methyltransferase [Bacillota bacterium]